MRVGTEVSLRRILGFPPQRRPKVVNRRSDQCRVTICARLVRCRLVFQAAFHGCHTVGSELLFGSLYLMRGAGRLSKSSRHLSFASGGRYGFPRTLPKVALPMAVGRTVCILPGSRSIRLDCPSSFTCSQLSSTLQAAAMAVSSALSHISICIDQDRPV